MRISEVAKMTGVRPSAIRYYESVGLLTPPPRIGGARYYDRSVLDRLTVIRFGATVGFSLDELRTLFAQWKVRTTKKNLAQRKLQHLRFERERLELAGQMLEAVKLCQCGTVRECVERLRKTSPAPTRLGRAAMRAEGQPAQF